MQQRHTHTYIYAHTNIYLYINRYICIYKCMKIINWLTNVLSMLRAPALLKKANWETHKVFGMNGLCNCMCGC